MSGPPYPLLFYVSSILSTCACAFDYIHNEVLGKLFTNAISVSNTVNVTLANVDCYSQIAHKIRSMKFTVLETQKFYANI